MHPIIQMFSFCCPTDAKALVEIDPSLRSAKESVPRLEKLQNDKNEKMKEEALGEFLPLARTR